MNQKESKFKSPSEGRYKVYIIDEVLRRRRLCFLLNVRRHSSYLFLFWHTLRIHKCQKKQQYYQGIRESLRKFKLSVEQLRG